MDDALVAELRSAFEIYDINGDGNITADEMHEIIEKCDINLTYDQFQDLIDNLDKNNDGKIVFEEFISVMAKKMSSVNKKKDLETTFNYFDRDGSGSIDRSEIYEIMKRFKKGITQEQVDIIMAQIDTDGSGKVNFEEFLKMMSM